MKRFLPFVFAVTACAPAAYATKADPILEAMVERKPDKAIGLIKKRLDSGAEPANAPRLTYWLARAEFQAKRFSEAIRTADRLRAKWPKSPFATKANFLKADGYVALKDFERADKIYLAETGVLISTKRKEDVAKIYLNIADKAYKPKTRDGLKPDYHRAETFYRLALGLGLSQEKQREARYRIARALHFRGDGWTAVRELQAFLKEWKDGAFVPEARFTLGIAQQKRGNLSEARKAYRDFLDDHAGHKLAADASYRIAKTFNMPTPHSDRDLERGVKAARDYAEKFAAHEWAPKAELAIGDAYMYRGRHDDAAQAYKRVIQKYGVARGGTARVATAKGAEAPGWMEAARAKVRLGDVLRAQRKYAEAIETWRNYLVAHPADRDSERAQRAILDAEFEIAADHYLAKRYEQATEAWGKFAARYPLDARNPRVMRLLGQIEYDQGRYAEAIKAWRALVSKYATYPEGSRGHYEMALTLANKLGDFDQAMKELEKVRGNYRWQAQQLLRKFKDESLKIVTEKIFRSDEKPVIKVTQRNLEKLSMRLYKIDMETYFRRTQRLTGLDGLDLALIAPDTLWEEKVADYVKWKESDHTVKLPVREPGVYAVTIAGGKLEATTIVQVSDLALITKATRRDLLVLAVDTRRNKAWSGVKVLVSDGKKVILEGVTGADGVWHKRDAALKDLANHTVFARGGGNMAGNPSGYVGGAVQVMTPRGLVYTDRPAYKPGEEVHVKAILRRIERGSYAFKAGEAYVLTVSSPRGDSIVRREVALDEFGTAMASVTLDPNAPLGTYRVQLVQKGHRKKDAAIFAGDFQVQQYKIEKVRVEVVFDRPVFMRGEKLTGKIKAQYQFGEPVSGKKVSYTLAPDGIYAEAMLSDKGEAAFSYETRNYDWDQTLVVTAHLADEGVSTRGTVRLATEEFSASAKVERPVYLVGDEALVTIEAKDVLDKPKGGVKFVVDAFVAPTASITRKPGGDPLTEQTVAEFARRDSGELRVGRALADADSQTGRALARFRLARGGTYIFRALAYDRFGNPIAAEARTTASGDDDAVRLRVFSGREELRVGEMAGIHFHSRVGAGSDLALVTFEADGVVGYKIVRMRAGENPFGFRVASEYAPNVRVAAAMLEGQELHQASTDFRVKRGLKVEVTAVDKVSAPGKKLSVKLRATDQNGRPARASLSLAAVDVGLFSLFPDNAPALADLFYGQSRDIVVATAASNKYRHEGTTKTISDELLAEDARRTAEESKGADKKISAREAGPSVLGALGGAGAMARPAPPASAVSGDMPIATGRVFGRAGGVKSAPRRYGHRYRLKEKNGKPDAAKDGDDFEVAERSVAGRGPLGPKVRAVFRDLAYWTPAVVTNEAGEAVVDFKLPDNTTTWRMTVRGVTAATLVGEGRDEVVSKRDFFVEARLPRAITEGDVVKPLVRVHNFTGAPVTADVTTSVTLGESKVTRTTKVEAPGRGAGEAGLDPVEAGHFKWGAKNVATVETTATAGAHVDREKTDLPLLPWGSERRAGLSGTSQSSVSRTVTLGDGTFERRAMTIDLGPPPNRLLVEMALSRQGLFAAAAGSIADWLLITHHVLEYLRARERGAADVAKLEAQLHSLAQSLAMAQNADGGFAWAGRGTSSPFVSAQALRALLLAREAGAKGPDRVFKSLVAYVGARFREQAEGNNDGKAALLYALAHVGDKALLGAAHVDVFMSANRLFRLRGRLSYNALAYLTLTLDRLGRRSEVAELSKQLARKVGTSFGALISREYDKTFYKRPIWFRDDLTTVALVVDAIQRGAPAEPAVKAGIDFLLARRYGFCWHSPRLTHAAIQALARYHGATRFARDRYRVAVRINGQAVSDVEVHSDGGLRHIEVPHTALNDGANRVELDLTGRGEFSYSVLMTGFTRGIDRAHEGKHLRVTRWYEPAPRRHDGRVLPRGFGILTGTVKTWKNKVSKLPLGERAQVSIELRGSHGGQTGYVLIEEPIPAGTSVDRESIAGGFVHYELRPDKIVFLVESTGWYTNVRYDLFGVVPGIYRVLPTRVVGAYDPAFLSTGKEASLEVLDKGAVSSDPYRVTPDEAYELGRREFEKKAYKSAAASLEKLLAGHGEQYTVRDNIYKEIVRMLLFGALDAKQSDKVVRYFEILKEKYPDLVVPLDKSVEIGAAYIAMRDFERGLQVLKATTEASFNVDSQVGGALDSNGEVAASARYMRDLLALYPDVSAVQNATYGLAQHLADLAKRAHEDKALKKQKLQKVGLLDDAIRVFWEFMGLYPENPTTDEAAFALSNTYLSREAHTETMGLTERFRRIFPTSSYLDAYEYIQALAAFALEKYGEAMRLCRQVAEGKYYNERKEKVESTNKDLAVFIMGQIHHALGEAAKALDRYKAIEEKFPDAREAIQNFQRVAMTVPEVTTVKPGELTQVKVSYRNVTEAALTVYKVDLMKLYLIHRDLNNITKVNLAGIKPLVERTVRFSEKPLYRDTQKTIDVAVGGKGAYLVVLKAKEVEASGMLLVSDLKLEVKEDTGAGRVRVQVLDSASSKPVRKVFVRVVGAGDGRFRGDTTDLRGVFNADGVSGRATVIAAKGTSYAFYRGLTGEATTDANIRINAPAAAPAKAFDGLQLEIMKRNIDVQQRVKQSYEQQLRNVTKGVQVDMAK